LATAASYGGTVATGLTTAISAMELAYTDAAGRPNPNIDGTRINFGDGLLGGAYGGATNRLTPGVYTFGTDVNIREQIFFAGTHNDVFIIQINGNLKQDAYKQVVLEAANSGDPTNKPLAKNIFWQVSGMVTVGAGAHMEGILLVKTAVTFETGSSLNGRVLTQTACSLQKATVVEK
jgi:hypothetical protein